MLGFCGLFSTSLGEEVSREAPPLYKNVLAPLLMPVNQALKTAEGMDCGKESTLIVLDQWFHCVDVDGRQMMANQVAYKTLTDAGVKTNGEDVFYYRRNEQRFYLILAETIQADGTVLPVKPNAILLQSPQRDADYSLYDDQAEVRIIYPNVKPGAVTHAIVVIEDLKARMRGEFTDLESWRAVWPTAVTSSVIDLPAEMAKRIQVVSIGSDVPVGKREVLPDQRVRLTWMRTRTPAQHYETARPPAGQAGPATRVTTLASWDQVSTWFAGLCRDRDQLSPELARQVDGWTRSASSRDEIVRILLGKVADEVRYVGLELGDGDYQPHRCTEVWENQYGDCKDKANLLVAFLRHKNVPASTALVNTYHLGVIDRRAPDFRVFSHAIVALPDGAGGYHFCDPTIMCAQPGMLSPESADRDVLLVKEAGAEWAHTPRQTAGSLHYRFDLKMGATGELSGWLTRTADGYHGASQRAHFRKLDPDERRKEMGSLLRDFYSGADVVDVITGAEDVSSGPDVIKAYFLVPGHPDSQGGRATLVFPQGPDLFPSLGQSADRESIFFLHRDRIQVTCTVALPPDLSPDSLPGEFKAETPSGTSQASWQFGQNTCRMNLEMNVLQSALNPQEFGRYYRTVQSLRAWLAKPVVLAPGKSMPMAKMEAPELDLPVMPSGEGQIGLVDKRYPETGNHDLRRAALEKTLVHFPDNRAVAFNVGVRLASLDWLEDKSQQVVDRLQSLLANYRRDVTPEDFSWGENLKAVALVGLKREAEALPILTRLARDPVLSAERRAIAALGAAGILKANTPTEALAILRVVPDTPTPRSPAVHSLMVSLLLQRDDGGGLRKALESLVQSHRGDLDAILTRIVNDSVAWTGPHAAERLQNVLAIVQELVPRPESDLEAALAAAQLHLSCGAIQNRLKESLARKPVSDWYTPSLETGLKTLQDFKRAMDSAEGTKDVARCLQLNVQSLVTFPVDEEFPRRLWEAANYCDWRERLSGKPADEPAYMLLLDLCGQLPNSHTYYFEGRILRAKHLARMGDRRGEQATYQEILRNPGLGKDFVVPVCKLLAASFEATGDYTGALELYRRMEEYPGDSAAAAGLLRAVFINLTQHRTAEALRIVGILQKASEEALKGAIGELQIREFIALSKSGQAEAFWAAAEQWWPRWQKLVGSLDVPAEGNGVVVPVISDLSELENEMKQAQRKADHRSCLESDNRLASAARWLPSLAAEVAGMYDTAQQLFPSKIREFNRVYEALLAVPHPAGVPGLRARQLYRAANYIDEQQPENALKVVAEFNAAPQPNDAISQNLRRMWADAALAAKKEMPACAAAIEQDLKNPELTVSRALMVDKLADLYHALGRAEDQEALLKRELDNPAIVADNQGHSTLAARYNQLVGSRQLAAKVKAWIKAFPLDWYDLAEPLRLDDPRLRNLDEILKDPGTQFSPAETVKLELLAAQDVTASIEFQQRVWQDAVRNLYFLLPTYDRSNRLAETVIGDEAFDDETRASLLLSVMIDSADHGRTEDFARWQKHSLITRMNSTATQRLASAKLVISTDRSSAKSVKGLVAALTEKEVGILEIAFIRDVFEDMLRVGDLAGAREMLEQIPSWRLGSGVGKTPEALQLDFSKRIRKAEETWALHEGLIRKVLEQFPNLPDRQPALYDDLRLYDEVPTTTPEHTLQACLFRIKTRHFSHDGMGFWRTFVRALASRPESEPLMVGLFRVALAEAKDDEQRADVVQFITSSFDLDNAPLRRQITALLAPYRGAGEAPSTTARIRIHEIQVALRTGEPVDLSTAFDGLRVPRVANIRNRMSLRHYTQTGDKAALKRLVDSLDSAQLLDPAQLDLTIPALDLLGMKTEADLARKTARRECRRAVVTSWASLDETGINRALDLAELLDDPEALPPGWVKAVSTGTANPWNQHRPLMIDAWLRRNWEEASRQAAQLIELYPNAYNSYWYRGMALHRLGRDGEAATALAVYTRYSKEELEYPEAVKLLEKLSPRAP